MSKWSKCHVDQFPQSIRRQRVGATAIEYALIASLIAVALVTILTNLGTKLSSEFNEISGVLK